MSDEQPPAMDAELATAIPRLTRASVLVIGDAMLDRYVYGNVARISPEAPIPVLAVDRELALPGGAGNVVRNLTALGAAVAFVSVVGDDQAGSDLTGLIGGQPNVEPWLLVQGGRCTTVKTRFIAGGQQLLRSDQEVTGAIHPKLAERMLRIAGDALAATSVTVLSDYRKGLLSGDVPAQIIEAARAASPAHRGGPARPGLRPLRRRRRGGAKPARAGGGNRHERVQRAPQSLPRPAGCARRTGSARWWSTAVPIGLSLVSADTVLHLPSRRLRGVRPVRLCRHSGLRDRGGPGDRAEAAGGGTAGQPGDGGLRPASPAWRVAQGTDLLAMLTPQGRALRKIVASEVAAEQVDRWRRLGLRTALIATTARRFSRARLETARAACDRLVLGLESTADGEETDAAKRIVAEAAGLASVDLVCVFPEGMQTETLLQLRPDLLIDVTPAPSVAELVRGWGGEVLAG